MADQREGPLHAFFQHRLQHAREIVRRVQMIALVRLAEAGEVERIDRIALGKRWNYVCPVLGGVPAQPVHQDHRIGAARARLVEHHAAAEHRLVHELGARVRSLQPIGLRRGKNHKRGGEEHPFHDC
jgi:hypothetical protein